VNLTVGFEPATSTVLDNLPPFASVAGAPPTGKLYQRVAV
jgi:hypothetical protein